MEDYVQALSRKYKSRANKILEAGNVLEKRTLSEVETNKYSSKISGLFRQVARSQSFVLANLADDHFGKMKSLYKDSFEVMGFFYEGEIVAFTSAFISRDTYELYYAGFDYNHNQKLQLYFNLLFSGLERAIKLGKSVLKLGRTSLDAKASLGAHPEELVYYFKAGKIAGVVNNWFANYFSSMEDGKWKLRSPMK